MKSFLETLREGGSSYRIEDEESGFRIIAHIGHEVGFNQIARLVLDKAGPTFAAFPRSDGAGGYESVHIIPHHS